MRFLPLCLVVVLLSKSPESARVQSCLKREPHSRDIDGRAAKLNRGNISISNCFETEECILKRNHHVEVTMHFKPDQAIDKLQSKIYANINGLSIPFFGFDGKDACTYLYDDETDDKATCPLKAHKNYRFVQNLFIERHYPQISVLVHWGLRSNHGDVVCFEIPARIK